MTTLHNPAPAADAVRHSLRAWALHFAARGWHVFPLTPGAKKPPVIDRWETRASIDPERITHWWRHTPYSLGIATGPSGLVVVDLDTPKPAELVPARWAALGIGSGAGVLRALAQAHGATVTPTYAVTTPSGGWHLYYTAPPGTALRNTHDTVGWKIDTRAHGGYVVAPGSPVPPSGYELVDDREPAELPSWLHQALTPTLPTGMSAPAQTVTTNPSGYACAAVRGECHRVRTAARGQHNAVLCRAAYALGQLVGNGLLDEATARADLTTAAGPLISADCDCTPHETDRVITAGLAAGARNPRRTTPRTSYRGGGMRPDIATALTAIDSAIGGHGCQHCAQPVGASPSPDFCSEDCQRTWHDQHTDTPPTAPPPARPLGWLGQPAPGAPVRAGHEVLDDVAAFVARFSVFPSEHCAPTLALWYAHTHATEQFYVTPRLILDSAEPGSGKTRVLEVAQYLVRAPEMTISATPAALFRLVSMGPITILFDEVDAIFNAKNGGSNEDLRGLLNAGYKRSATIARCVGDAKTMKVERFPVYAPAALAGIAGAMPTTITTRAITIHMRRRRTDEPVEPFRERQISQEAKPLREELAAWIDSVSGRLADATPQMPEGVTDRPAEIWEPLLAIADAASGHWPTTARAACRHFTLATGPQITSIGIRLLADLQGVFTRAGTDRIITADILAALGDLEESPWADLHGKPLDSRRLSKELARYGIKPKNLRLSAGGVVKGYRTDGEDGLADVWSRYLPGAATSATAATTQVNQVADAQRVADPSATAATEHTGQVAAVAAVADTGHPPGGVLTSEVAAVAVVADETGEAR